MPGHTITSIWSKPRRGEIDPSWATWTIETSSESSPIFTWMSTWEVIIHCEHILVWICPAWHPWDATWAQGHKLRSEELSKRQNQVRHETGKNTPSSQAGKPYRPMMRGDLVRTRAKLGRTSSWVTHSVVSLTLQGRCLPWHCFALMLS